MTAPPQVSTATEPALKRVEMLICEPCLNGVGEECHTPGCAMFLHRVDLPFPPDVYKVIPDAAQAEPRPLSEPETHAISHARYQVNRATPDDSVCCFDYQLVADLLRVIDRAKPTQGGNLATGERGNEETDSAYFEPTQSGDKGEARQALEDTQSLLAMVEHIGPDVSMWKGEGVSQQIVDQMVVNRAVLAGAPQPASNAGGETEDLHKANQILHGLLSNREAEIERLRGDAGGEVSQHIGWLKQYVHGMTADNWQDMRLRAERQLEELSRDIRGVAYSSGNCDESADRFQKGFNLALKQSAEVVKFCGECDCPRMTVDAIKALSIPSTEGETL